MYISESGICPVTDQGLTLAKQARLEKLKTGNIISCSCGFIRNIEINL